MHSDNNHGKDHGKDNIYASALNDVPQFRFDQQVVDVFPDMIKRSVPGYSTILAGLAQIVERYAQAQTHCYDLGCSLGASLLAMRHRVLAEGVSIVGIDNSAAMIERCRQVVAADASECPVELIHGDILKQEFKPMSVCVLNFTLQFIEPAERLALLKKISAAMVPGGVLLLSEKLHFDDSEHNELMIKLHHNFKRSNGYSELEIAQKREAIEKVLLPESFACHKQRLLDAGFRSADLWFQCFNFSSIIAFK
ncbi:carboxy-S-adenosyl-L-methionine synthase CmoA [Agaribacterium haliotis]|uniref:carboxy-S-adenosyl-L-methionine synthase CmoA n=1 Tax=Agaribacterium haliotis TaxID=2013869 RepID=UPI000BB56A61|nr:carboxy-S-adenosyl-L-methionine synthase CmoA [Agaribacterium haliotis]